MLQRGLFREFKVGCVFPINVLSILPHAKFGRNDHREDEPHFTDTIICPLARYSKDIKECLLMIHLEMELKETAHKKTISEHNIEQARLLSNLEEKENNLNITKKDLDRITRERVRQIYITHQNNFLSFRLN